MSGVTLSGHLSGTQATQPPPKAKHSYAPGILIVTLLNIGGLLTLSALTNLNPFLLSLTFVGGLGVGFYLNGRAVAWLNNEDPPWVFRKALNGEEEEASGTYNENEVTLSFEN